MLHIPNHQPAGIENITAGAKGQKCNQGHIWLKNVTELNFSVCTVCPNQFTFNTALLIMLNNYNKSTVCFQQLLRLLGHSRCLGRNREESFPAKL